MPTLPFYPEPSTNSITRAGKRIQKKMNKLSLGFSGEIDLESEEMEKEQLKKSQKWLGIFNLPQKQFEKLQFVASENQRLGEAIKIKSSF
ncbi:hypothetical protein M0R45_029568 [Rubus argutus]|uniref:Uncharacterized protein n=1 Tax=Rubus argutus TaxID=59490 RepID=A0AAW1W8V6_RUBAR